MELSKLSRITQSFRIIQEGLRVPGLLSENKYLESRKNIREKLLRGRIVDNFKMTKSETTAIAISFQVDDYYCNARYSILLHQYTIKEVRQ